MSDTGLDGPRGVIISSSSGNGSQEMSGGVAQVKPKKDYKGFVAGVFSGIAKLSGGFSHIIVSIIDVFVF